MFSRLIFFLLISILTALPAQGQATDPATWRHDVEILMDSLRQIHPGLYEVHSRNDWKQAAANLKKSLPNLTRAEAVLGFFKLVAMIEDGHTGIYPVPSPNQKLYPVRLYLFSDGLYVRKASNKYTSLFGHRITEINGVRIQEVFEKLRPYISADNKMWFINKAPFILQFQGVLYGIGLSDSLRSPLVLTLENSKGKTWKETVEAVPRSQMTQMIDVAKYVNSQNELPLYRRLQSNYAFKYLPENKILYFRFRSVHNEEDEPFAAFVKRMFNFVESHEVEKFVVDLRGNTGGNNFIVTPLLHNLIKSSKVNCPGHLFVIINRGVFSAAMNIAARIERHTHALFVGEPTGTSPNFYGPAGNRHRFRLPASGLIVHISDAYWQESLPHDNRPWIYPDIPARLSYDGYITGRDPAMQSIIKYNPAKAPEWLYGSTYVNSRRPTQKSHWQVVVE